MNDICCIGHITLDKIVTPRKTTYMPGGTSYYFSHGTRRAVKGSSGKNRTASLCGFFRSELAKPLTASECGVTFADRKEKKHSSLH